MDAEAAKDHAVVAAMEDGPPSSACKRKPDWGKSKKLASKKNKSDGDRPAPTHGRT